MLSSLKQNGKFKIHCLVFSSVYSSQLLALEKNKTLTPTESLLPMLGGLLAILAIIFILAFIFKRFSNFGLSSKNIKVIESQVIGNKEKLMIIQVQQQQFLIGVTGHSISQLGELKKFVLDSKKTAEKEKLNIPSAPSQFDITALPFGKIISQLINSPARPSGEKKATQTSRLQQREIV